MISNCVKKSSKHKLLNPKGHKYPLAGAAGLYFESLRDSFCSANLGQRDVVEFEVERHADDRGRGLIN